MRPKWWGVATVWLGMAAHASAHLLADGHATVNVQGGSAFVVISLPVAWLGAVDDDGDGRLNAAELHKHRTRIIGLLAQRLQLNNGGSALPLRDLLLSTSPAHDRTDGAGTHVLALGSSPLPDPSGPVTLSLNLQGPPQVLRVTATRDPAKETATLQGPQGRVVLLAKPPAPPRSSAGSHPPSN